MTATTTKWRAVVTMGKQQWVQNGFANREAALKAAEGYASKHKKQATGYRAEKE